MHIRNTGICIALLFLFHGIHARISQTCKDLETELSLHNATIEQIKLELLEYKLAERKIQDVWDECTAYKGCFRCLHEDNNPNCGWCFFRNRCSLKENCPGHESDSNSWSQKGCPRIRKITPHVTDYHTARELELSIPHLPAYDGVFICSFDILGKSFVTKANRTEKGLSCYTPCPSNLPKIPEGNYSTSVKVSVRTAQGPNFASTTNFTIYDCSRINSCTECTSTILPCFWCLESNKCWDGSQENCTGDIIITSIGSPGPSLRPGPDFCPRIRAKQGYEEIRVPTKTSKKIAVNIENILSSFLAQTTFTCNVEEHDVVKGNLLGDTIYCDAIEFYGLEKILVETLSFNVYWGGGERKLDNPDNIHVILFDCSLMATSCSTCLSVPSEQYNCGWCEESNSCMTRDQCKSQWLDRTQKCTKPVIKSFYPKSGLITREANITIDGENFGREFEDIESEIRLLSEGGDLIAKCVAYKELYIAGIRVVCRLAIPKIPPKTNEILKGFFEIKVYDEFTALSTEAFSFVDPIITSLSPSAGIESGGTLLEIRGHHMDAGSKVEAFVGDFPCNITNRNLNVIQCITSSSGRVISRGVQVLFDGEEKNSEGFFSYVEDPRISRVRNLYRENFPSGSPSGGTNIIVEGYYFDHLQNPLYFYVIVENEEYIGECTVESSSVLKCLSPTVPADRLNFFSEESFLNLDYGFKMGELGNLNYSKSFRMYPDPFFMPFKEEGRIKDLKSDYLLIEGNHLDKSLSLDAITIEIGNKICLLTSISRSELTCRVPDTQPPSKSNDTSKLPEVVVKVAGRMEFFIGYLRYKQEDDILS